MSQHRNLIARLLLKVLAMGVGSFLCLLLGPTPRALSIPAFARKYQTSCSTCHNNFPELNDFGGVQEERIQIPEGR